MRRLSRKPRGAVQNPSRAFWYPGTRFGSSPRPRAPQKAPRAQPGGWTRGAASSPKAAGLEAATEPRGEGVGHGVPRPTLTYLLTYHGQGLLSSTFSLSFRLTPEARPPRKTPPDRNFEFYVRRGTFGDINGGNDIEIPSDVRISTGDPNGAIYLTDPVTLPTGDSREFFSARSLAPGSVGNAPAGVFNRHNFTGYTAARFGTLLVTNNLGLVGGRDAESDEDYRFRVNVMLEAS